MLPNTGIAPNVKLAVNSFPDFLLDISPNFGQLHDVSLTAVKFPDIFTFSRQAITLNTVKEQSFMLAKTHLTLSSKSNNVLLRAAVISSVSNSHSFVLISHQSLNILPSHIHKPTFNNNWSLLLLLLSQSISVLLQIYNVKAVNILLRRIIQMYSSKCWSLL